MTFIESREFETTRDWIVDHLRREIIRGQLLPGERLNQSELGRRFGVSRMPVRDALHALHAEGLVTMHPRLGARVVSIDLVRCRHIYQIREVVEGWAIEQSIPRMERRHLLKIQKLGERLKAAKRVDDVSAWLETDRQFHFSTYEPLDNPELIQVVTELWNGTQQLRRSYCMLPGALEKAYAYHTELLDAITSRDAARAGELERAHIRETLRSVAAHLEPRPASGVA